MDRIRLYDRLNTSTPMELDTKSLINDNNQSMMNSASKRKNSSFKDKYQIKCHLSAGAHGIILWALDRQINTNNRNDIESSNCEYDYYCSDNCNDNHEHNFKHHKQYAIKRIFIRNRTIPVKLIREIKSLQYLNGHPNVIELLDVCVSGSTINLVFPLLPTNLTTLIYGPKTNRKSNDEPKSSLIKSDQSISLYFHMILNGLNHLHCNGIIHRDLKPSNILIDWNGQLKLADFGQARAIDIHIENEDKNEQGFSNDVCTRWYRAPELLWGATHYGSEVDIWSVGCILAEMLQKQPLFHGETDIEQLSLIVRSLGNPEPGEWTENLPDFNKIQFIQLDSYDRHNHSENDLPKWLENFSQRISIEFNESMNGPKYTLNLLSKMICYNQRLTTDQLLKHEYFNDSNVSDDNFLIKPKFIEHLSGPPQEILKR